MSKKQNKLDSLLGLVKKGQKLYNEYGETVVSLANSLKRRNQANIVESSEVLVDEIQEETAIAKVEEAAVPSVQKPTDIKGY